MTPKTAQTILKAMKYCKESERKTFILNYIKNDQARKTTNDRTETITSRTQVQCNHDQKGT
jgi:hypothetical protein